MATRTSPAGVYREAQAKDLDYDVLSHMVPINVTGPNYCRHNADPRMSTHRGGAGGTIVHVSNVPACTAAR